ncbi:MAG: lactate permease LctP family transporter [Burkholderiales bacterium]|jgi:L-lactate transport|nr:lactate permease LctP family transporter [Burkholderiales bacterium]
MVWVQQYDPFHFLPASALVALLPILVFIFSVAVFRVKMIVAASLVLVLSILLAVIPFGMPVLTALSAALYGFFYGFLPIGWIILNVVFLYRLTVKSGAFNTMRASITSITPDARLQLILIGFAFSAFLEGVAGYGTPVAISAALLVGLGFAPLSAARLCLIGNTAPVAFGAMGTSLAVAAQVSHVNIDKLSMIAGGALPILSLVALVCMVVLLSGVKGAREVFPAMVVAGVAFAGAMSATALFVGIQLPAITSGLFSMFALTVFLRFWQPKNIVAFADHAPIFPAKIDTPPITLLSVARAWFPYVLLTAVIILWSSRAFQSWFTNHAFFSAASWSIDMPFLHQTVVQTAPIVLTDTARDAVFKFDTINALGSGIFLSAWIAAMLLKVKVKDTARLFGQTCRDLIPMIFSIGLILAFATVANYSGMSSTVALLFSKIGALYPLLAPGLGAFGVLLTGSDTSSNALFAPLQAAVAGQIGVSDSLLVAANSLGGAAGKMISPQSIAVACAAVGLLGREGDVMNATLKISLVFAALSGIAVLVLSWVI